METIINELLPNAAQQSTPITSYVIDNTWAIQFSVPSENDLDSFMSFNRDVADFVNDLESVDSDFSEVALPILKRVQRKHEKRIDELNRQNPDDHNQDEHHRGLNFLRGTFMHLEDFAVAQTKIIEVLARRFKLNCRIVRVTDTQYQNQVDISDT